MDHGTASTWDDSDDTLPKSRNESVHHESRPWQGRTRNANNLGALSFLHSPKTSSSMPVKADSESDRETMDAEGAKRGSSIATALHLQQSYGRKRKGSLRKAAMAKTRQGSSSPRIERVDTQTPTITTTLSTPSPDKITANFFDSEITPGDNPFGRDSQISQQQRSVDHPTPSPFGVPKGPYMSTTDEEQLSLKHPPTSSSSFSVEHKPAMSLSLRRLRRPVPHALLADSLTFDDLEVEDDWDYSETEWWGWVILIATWIVFVVVMGSCFGVWTWAWDVGETPYAPPDLEDDDTLPITGYYPALIVCTAVMSWVWVVVAWVGMKFYQRTVADDV